MVQDYYVQIAVMDKKGNSFRFAGNQAAGTAKSAAKLAAARLKKHEPSSGA